MPRYFFDIEDRDGSFPDEVGLELPDMDAAIFEARRALADMAKDMLVGDMDGSVQIHIRDGAEGPVRLSVEMLTERRDKHG